MDKSKAMMKKVVEEKTDELNEDICTILRKVGAKVGLLCLSVDGSSVVVLAHAEDDFDSANMPKAMEAMAKGITGAKDSLSKALADKTFEEGVVHIAKIDDSTETLEKLTSKIKKMTEQIKPLVPPTLEIKTDKIELN